MENIVVLVTGASSGIGKAIKSQLDNEGYIVYGTSRKSSFDDKSKMIPMDVTDSSSIKEAINYIIRKEDKIDILINNAGFGIAGSIEDTNEEECFNQLNTNFFGVHRTIKEVLPHMRSNNMGTIVNIGSVAGLISIPYQSMYSCAKYSVEALTEALRIELKPFNIKVCLIEPGDTKTGFTDNRIFTKESSESPYKEYFKKSIAVMEKDERNGKPPETVAMAVSKIIKKKNPPIRKIVGFNYNLLVILKRLLPSRMVEWILGSIYGGY